jgi:ATP phosphoribosyltransferase
MPKNSGLKNKSEEVLKEFKLSGDIIEIRGEDIPCFVLKLIKGNKKTIGITGEDLFKEFILNNRNTGLKIIKRITWKDTSCLFQKPALCLLGPKNRELIDLGKNLKICINSKYKELSKKNILNFLENKGYRFEKIYVSGATEEFFLRGIADLVIDIVCSGKSAEEAGLKVYDKLFESDLVLIGEKNEKI